MNILTVSSELGISITKAWIHAARYHWLSKSPDITPTEWDFHLLKTRLKVEEPTNKQHIKVTAVKA